MVPYELSIDISINYLISPAFFGPFPALPHLFHHDALAVRQGADHRGGTGGGHADHLAAIEKGAKK